MIYDENNLPEPCMISKNMKDYTNEKYNRLLF